MILGYLSFIKKFFIVTSLVTTFMTVIFFMSIMPMIIFMAMPFMTGLMNIVVPLQIGAVDMAFPRVNMASYQAYVMGGIIMLTSFFIPGGAAQAAVIDIDNAELARLMGNLGGHDLPALLKAFREAQKHDRPVCFIAYTIKGMGLPLAGHKDKHAGVMNTAQFASFRAGMKVPDGREWDRFCTIGDPSGLEEFLSAVPFFASGTRRHRAAKMATPGPVFLDEREISTQAGTIADLYLHYGIDSQ